MQASSLTRRQTDTTTTSKTSGAAWAALWIVANIFVAWSSVHHFQFFGRGGDHGEAIVLYLGGFLAIAILGAGRFSLDYKLQIGSFFRRRSQRP